MFKHKLLETDASMMTALSSVDVFAMPCRNLAKRMVRAHELTISLNIVLQASSLTSTIRMLNAMGQAPGMPSHDEQGETVHKLSFLRAASWFSELNLHTHRKNDSYPPNQTILSHHL